MMVMMQSSIVVCCAVLYLRIEYDPRHGPDHSFGRPFFNAPLVAGNVWAALSGSLTICKDSVYHSEVDVVRSERVSAHMKCGGM
jgi:hypothetical protein